MLVFPNCNRIPYLNAILMYSIIYFRRIIVDDNILASILHVHNSLDGDLEWASLISSW